jgi:hypothetical protein
MMRLRLRNTVTIRRFFIRGLPTLPLHGINSDSAENYELIDKESTMRMLFQLELPAQGLGIHRRNGYSDRNYQLGEEKST